MSKIQRIKSRSYLFTILTLGLVCFGLLTVTSRVSASDSAVSSLVDHNSNMAFTSAGNTAACGNVSPVRPQLTHLLWASLSRTNFYNWNPLAADEPCATPTFAPATSYAAGRSPRSIATGDFNGDGKLDLVTANRNLSVSPANQVSILLNSGAGSFAAAKHLAVGANMQPRFVTAGDFNGDANLDLAVASETSLANNISIFLGDGMGNFGPPRNLAAGNQPRAIGVGDFNGDGSLDLAAANYGTNTTPGTSVSIFTGNGDGTFSAGVNYAVGTKPISIAVADVNADGRLDLAVANESSASNSVTILLGDGAGSFGSPVNFPIGTSPAMVILADLNGDGRSDVATANRGSSNVSILIGDGAGNFGAATNFAAGTVPNSVGAADVNRDNYPDLIVSNETIARASILLGSGSGSFSAPTRLTVGTAPSAVTIGDFNADGRPDFATSNATTNDASVVINTCNRADLTLTKSHARNFSAGYDGVYTLTVRNVGTAASSGTISVTDMLPNGLSFISGFGDGWSCSASGSEVICTNNDSLAVNAASNITLNVSVTSTASPDVTNTANVANESDVNHANNYASDHTLVNLPPVALEQSLSTDEDTEKPIILTATDSEGGDLTYNVVTQPAHGTLSGLAPNLVYTPATNYNGADSFTFRANDGQADSNVANISITINAVNDAPVTSGDSYSLDEDNTLNIEAPGVISNDSDVDADALTVTLISGPTHGALTLNPNGSFTYVPGPDYNGADSFNYKINDGSLDSATATVSLAITPVNDAPVADGQSIILDEDAGQSVTLNATDVEASQLTYTIVTQPAHGTLGGAGASLFYTPVINYNGPDSFSFKANDGQTDSNVANVSVTVNPADDAPIAAGESYSVNAANILNVSAPEVLANDVDADGNGLSAVLQTGPVHGSLSLNSNGSFTYTPEDSFSGSDGFTYAATDGAYNSNLASVVITVNPVVDLSLSLSDSADPIAVGATFSYLLTVVNNGPSAATNVLVTDSLPSSLVFVSASPTQGTCEGTSTINCNLGPLQNGAIATVTIEVTPSTAEVITNTASVTATEADPDASNNSDSESTAVVVGECTSANFSPATNFAVRSLPRAAVARDFNGDGKIDVAVANRNTNDVSILLGNGAGGFGAATNVAVVSTPQSLTAGDFNEDGNIDLAVANRNSSNVTILVGNGAGRFSAAGNFNVATQPVSIAAADFNGDGHSDLVTANESTAANNVSILLGDGAGGFGTATNFPVGAGPSSVAVGDFNGDGLQDLAAANFKSNNVSILAGNGVGGFGAATNFAVGTAPTFVIAGEFNGDRFLDLAVSNETSNNLSILLGTGTGFGAPTNHPTGTAPRSISTGDFNVDGRTDLAVANRLSNEVSILDGDGAGNFGAAHSFATGTQPYFVITNDFNRDSRTDLLTVNAGSSNVSVLINACGAADLSLTKTHAEDFQVGTEGVYALSVTNIGAGSTFGTTTVTDTLPAGLSFISATGEGWTCSASGQAVTCTSPDSLASGAKSSIMLRVSVGVTAAPGVTNTANLTNPADVNAANNSASDATSVKASTDLSITKTASASRVAVGNNLVYTLTVINNGPSAATGVSVTDVLPAEVTLVSVATTKGTCSGTSTVNCNLGSLALDANAKITITVTVNAEGTLANTASVTGVEVDPDTSNNSSTIETIVGLGSDLSIEITGSPNPVATGTNLTYTITVSNNGEEADSITVTDNLPAETIFISCTATGGVCGGSGNNRTVTYNSLSSGASAIITLVSTVKSNVANNSFITNTATVTSVTPDPNSGNNTGTAGVTVVAPIVSVNPTSVDFGGQIVTTSSAPQIVSVMNNGSAALIFTGVTLTGLHPTHFAITSNTCSGPGVAPGASCAVGVKFTPGVIGNRSAILTLQNNAGNSPQGVQLLGQGTGTTAAAWGANRNGQLGNGLTSNSSTPVQVSGLNGGVVFSGGTGHSLALKPDGTVWAWGANSNGQLGNGTTVRSLTPVQVAGLTSLTRIAAGGNHSLALKSDGTVWAWGANNAGQLGDNTSVARRLSPVGVTNLTDVVAIAARGDHSLALKSDGTVWSWGENTYGQVGDGTTTKRLAPVRVTSLIDVIEIAAGAQHSLALKADGTVRTWGSNTNGQLGDATTVKRLNPVIVSGLTDVIAIAAGTNHSLALKSNNSLFGWGANNYGQLGSGTTTKSTVPVQTSSGPFKGIAAGASHSIALRTDGVVFGSGLNTSGQLGNGTTSNSLRFVQASSLSGIVAIASGDNHSLGAAGAP